MKSRLSAARLAGIFMVLSGIVVWYAIAQQAASGPIVEKKTRLLMGTIVDITVPLTDHLDRTRAAHAIDQAFDEIDRLERIFSVYLPDSEVSDLNRLTTGTAMPVCPELFMILEKAVEYKKRTNGVFDVTIKPLRDLWQEACTRGALPSERALATARAAVDARAIILDRATRSVSFRRPGMAVDLGGIVKGYAADRAALILKQNGIAHAIVSVGSGMYCLGGKTDNRAWIIAIKHPRDTPASFDELAVYDKGIDTSGDYERYYMLDGKRYSHIIDPRSGIPVGDDIVSATVLAPDSMIADIYATTLCILGEEGLRLAEAEGVDALIVTLTNGTCSVKTTKGFEARYGGGKKSHPAP